MTHPFATDVFAIFRQLNAIPRPSWHEERVADFLCAFARHLHLEYERDAENCVVIRKAATPGYEGATPLAILNHCDMVCVAEEGKAYDPLTSPIEAYEEDGWIKARSTSLGADNGIGLSMALALLQSDDIPHPALEVITTTNEEDGMTGAARLSEHFLKARRILNLDSEDYDTMTLGSAGALLQKSVIPLTTVPLLPGCRAWKVRISGGLGGHSGVDINKHRSNAILLMARFLQRLSEMGDMLLISIDGGQAGNAIPIVCEAVVAVRHAHIRQSTDAFQQFLTEQYAQYEDALRITIQEHPVAPEATAIEASQGKAIIAALAAMPYGPLAMSRTMPGTVETSNNTGLVRTERDHLTIVNYSRSFDEAQLSRLGAGLRAAFTALGGESKVIMDAPAWTSATDSPFVALAERTFHDVLGFRPRKVAMHFALEAGYFMKKYPGAEMLSIGPRIVEPHSVKERVSIATVNDIWAVVKELLRRMRDC